MYNPLGCGCWRITHGEYPERKVVDEMKCDYCGRSRSINQTATCDGCGAALSPVGVYGDGSGMTGYVYDSRVFAGEVPSFLGYPGKAIPVTLYEGYVLPRFIRLSK